MNQHIDAYGSLSAEDRFRILDQIILKITPGNKVNLIVYDGENYYVHKNEEGTLYVKESPETSVFSTRALDDGAWEDVPSNRLLLYRDGSLVQRGTKHNNSYVYNEEDYKYLYMAYANIVH